MARMNAFLNASGTGRLVDHPKFTALSNGDVSAWVRVAFDRSEIDPATKSPKVDVLPFQMYISKERFGKMPMYWAFKGSRVTLTFAPRSFMKTTPEGNRSEITLEIDDFEVLDTQAETNARLQRYAAKGDQVAVAALAQRNVSGNGAGAASGLPTSLPAQGAQQGQGQAQGQIAPQQGQFGDVLADVPWLQADEGAVAPEWAQD